MLTEERHRLILELLAEKKSREIARARRSDCFFRIDDSP